mgnify:CR=1 FL=1
MRLEAVSLCNDFTWFTGFGTEEFSSDYDMYSICTCTGHTEQRREAGEIQI